MCELICDVICCCVWSSDAGKISVYEKIVIENQNKRKYKNQINVTINLHLKDCLGMEFIVTDS